MKKTIASLIALTALCAVTALASTEPPKETPKEAAPQKPKLEQSDGPHTYKKCMKICKEEIGEPDKCERICVTLKK